MLPFDRDRVCGPSVCVELKDSLFFQACVSIALLASVLTEEMLRHCRTSEIEISFDLRGSFATLRIAQLQAV